jgi:DNA-binding NarL/FixJ family response regulator
MFVFPHLGLILAMPSPSRVKVREIDRPVRILIADDHPGIRKTVRSTLEQHPRFEVVGEAEDGAKAIREARRLKPDVVVLNVTMPVLNGFEAAREIKTSLPKSAIVILSLNTDQLFIEEAKKIGARAYVAKSEAGKALVKAIEVALKGDDFVLVE